MGECSINGCENRHYAKSWCDKHYKRWRAHGDPEFTAIRPHGLTLEEAFRWHMSGDPPDSGCWEWKSGTRKGYGILEFEGKYLGAHVVSYTIHFGPVQEGEIVRHKVCDNPVCVHPLHLMTGTTLDNVQDRQEANRQARGVTQALAKLNDNSVREIRALYRASNLTQSELAYRYGVSQSTISEIIRGETWSHA